LELRPQDYSVALDLVDLTSGLGGPPSDDPATRPDVGGDGKQQIHTHRATDNHDSGAKNPDQPAIVEKQNPNTGLSVRGGRSWNQGRKEEHPDPHDDGESDENQGNPVSGS
jgi:hypothetical protein